MQIKSVPRCELNLLVFCHIPSLFMKITKIKILQLNSVLYLVLKSANTHPPLLTRFRQNYVI